MKDMVKKIKNNIFNTPKPILYLKLPLSFLVIMIGFISIATNSETAKFYSFVFFSVLCIVFGIEDKIRRNSNFGMVAAFVCTILFIYWAYKILIST